MYFQMQDKNDYFNKHEQRYKYIMIQTKSND